MLKVGTIINVKQCDIDRGCTRNAYNCPIARALKRAGMRGVGVCKGSAGNDHIDFTLPKIADRFIDAFDGGEKVKPFSFKLGRELK